MPLRNWSVLNHEKTNLSIPKKVLTKEEFFKKLKETCSKYEKFQNILTDTPAKVKAPDAEKKRFQQINMDPLSDDELFELEKNESQIYVILIPQLMLYQQTLSCFVRSALHAKNNFSRANFTLLPVDEESFYDKKTELFNQNHSDKKTVEEMMDIDEKLYSKMEVLYQRHGYALGTLPISNHIHAVKKNLIKKNEGKKYCQELIWLLTTFERKLEKNPVELKLQNSIFDKIDKYFSVFSEKYSAIEEVRPFLDDIRLQLKIKYHEYKIPSAFCDIDQELFKFEKKYNQLLILPLQELGIFRDVSLLNKYKFQSYLNNINHDIKSITFYMDNDYIHFYADLGDFDDDEELLLSYVYSLIVNFFCITARDINNGWEMFSAEKNKTNFIDESTGMIFDYVNNKFTAKDPQSNWALLPYIFKKTEIAILKERIAFCSHCKRPIIKNKKPALGKRTICKTGRCINGR